MYLFIYFKIFLFLFKDTLITLIWSKVTKKDIYNVTEKLYFKQILFFWIFFSSKFLFTTVFNTDNNNNKCF